MKAARRTFWSILLAGTAVLVAVGHLPDTSQHVSSNLDGLEWRQLATTTTTVHPTTTTVPPGEVVVIYGTRVIRIARTPATAALFAQLERLQP